MLFQIVRLEYSATGGVIARRETEPLFELREHAMAMAELEAVRFYDESEYDAQHDCVGLPPTLGIESSNLWSRRYAPIPTLPLER